MKAPLIPVAEIPGEGAKVVDFFGREVLVYMANGAPRAAMNVCLHLGGPLERKGNRLVCAWHGAEFDCATGKCLQGPAPSSSSAMFLPTRVEDGVLTYVYGA